MIRDVLVVDDGSRDGTASAARATGAEVHVLPNNRGKGAALRAAFDILFSNGFTGVVTLDADGQHLPEEIPRLLEAAGDADLVLGTRDHLFGEMSALRRCSNRLSSRAISWAAGQPVSDVQTGFRFYARELIERTGFPGAAIRSRERGGGARGPTRDARRHHPGATGLRRRQSHQPLSAAGRQPADRRGGGAVALRAAVMSGHRRS